MCSVLLSYFETIKSSRTEKLKSPAIWSSGNAFVTETGGLRFKSRAGQIGHSVANGLPQLQHCFERGVQTFHHLPFIHPAVNHGHLINGLGLGLGLALDMRSHRRLITVKFYHRDTLARS